MACNNDVAVIVNDDQKSVIITNHGYTILTGHRDFSTGLWSISLSMTEPPPPQKINIAYHTNSFPDLVAFLHAAEFIPSTTTWRNAIKKKQSWPGLTTEVFSKYLPNSPATAMGHMDQTRKHVRTTKTDQPISHKDNQQETNNDPTNNVFATIKETGKVYTDQTGRFSVRSSVGNQYILVLYDYDSNAILTEALKTRQVP